MYESSLTLHYLETAGGDAVGRGRERGQDGDAGILQRRGGSAVCPTHRPALNLTNYSALYPPISPSVIPPSFHTSLPFIPLLCFYLFSHHLTPHPPFPSHPPARANNNLQGEIWLARRRAEGGTVCCRSDTYTGNIIIFFSSCTGRETGGETRCWERERRGSWFVCILPSCVHLGFSFRRQEVWRASIAPQCEYLSHHIPYITPLACCSVHAGKVSTLSATLLHDATSKHCPEMFYL